MCENPLDLHADRHGQGNSHQVEMGARQTIREGGTQL